MYNTLRETAFCAHDVTLFVTVYSPVSRYCSITFSIAVSSDNAFFFRNVDRTVAGNVETMSLEMII